MDPDYESTARISVGSRYNQGMAPIKVRGRFATAYDTAKALGVSRSRTEELINRARTLVNGSTKSSRKPASKSRPHAKGKASARRAGSGR